MPTKIYLETAGCSANQADSEQMAGLLKRAKFEIVDDPEEAYILIFSTCTVKGPTERKFFNRLEEVKQKYHHKIIIIAGCIPQSDPEKVSNYSLIGPRQIHKVVEVVEEAINGNILHALNDDEVPSLNQPRCRMNNLIAIIPIARGCLGNCTYCKTKSARGNLVSYSIEEIKKEVELAAKDGAKEIWLTSQDNGCYGFDINTNLAKLLEELVNVPGKFMIRLGMMNPDHLLKYKDDFIQILEHPKIFKFLHLPVQSGSNEILKKMNRFYTVEEFNNLVVELRVKFPDLSIATDIIIGFPGETEEQFQETVRMVKAIMPEAINLSKFWPRSKTPAEKMEPVPGEEIKRRSVFITKVRDNISKIRNERWIGWKGRIVIDEQGTEKSQRAGRNYAYKKIVVEGVYNLGDVLEVRIGKVGNFCLFGKVIG